MGKSPDSNRRYYRAHRDALLAKSKAYDKANRARRRLLAWARADHIRRVIRAAWKPIES